MALVITFDSQVAYAAGYSVHYQDWKYRLEIEYRYSLIFRHRMQNFFNFFFIIDWGLSLLFCVGKSVLINRYFFSE